MDYDKEFILDFVNLVPPQGMVTARIVTSPGHLKRIVQALAGLKHVIKSDSRDSIIQWTTVLNEATKHLAEVAMNRSVRAALAGKNVDNV